VEESRRDLVHGTIPEFFPEVLKKSINVQSGWLASGARFQPGTSPIRSKVPYVAAKWFALLLGRFRVQISARRSAILAEAFRDFPQSLQVNAGIVPSIKPRPLPSISFPMQYSRIILSLDAIRRVYSEVLTASLNKS
jgi:hypothetical protein